MSELGQKRPRAAHLHYLGRLTSRKQMSLRFERRSATSQNLTQAAQQIGSMMLSLGFNNQDQGLAGQKQTSPTTCLPQIATVYLVIYFASPVFSEP